MHGRRARRWASTSPGIRELAKTPEGYYQVRGGIDYAIAKSLAVAPFADLLWMETKTADLADARQFADAIHAVYPDKMLAYNLSPSFNWDTTGMSDDEMRRFPEELGKMGFVFNFITYGGHQIDGLAARGVRHRAREDGMLALARLQRKFRLLESPVPDAADARRRAAGRRRAHGRLGRNGDHQGDGRGLHAVPAPGADRGAARSCSTELARALGDALRLAGPLKVTLRPHTAGSEVLELSVTGADGERLANVVFAHHRTTARANDPLDPRPEHVRPALRRKRLMTLLHLFLIHRYKAVVGPLPHPDRGQPPPDRADGRRRDLRCGERRGGRYHRGRRRFGAIRELVATDSAALSALIAVG